jgi:hypothetical protein
VAGFKSESMADFRRNHHVEPREALLEALLRFVEEDLATRPR